MKGTQDSHQRTSDLKQFLTDVKVTVSPVVETEQKGRHMDMCGGQEGSVGPK